MELDEWLKTVHVLALKAFAYEMPGVHDTKRSQVEQFILSNPVARDMALRSKAIMETARTPSEQVSEIAAEVEKTLDLRATGPPSGRSATPRAITRVQLLADDDSVVATIPLADEILIGHLAHGTTINFQLEIT